MSRRPISLYLVASAVVVVTACHMGWNASVMARLKLILIDKNRPFLAAAKTFLEQMEEVAEVITAQSLHAAKKIIASRKFDMVISDTSALGWQWARAIGHLRGPTSAHIKVVLLSLDDSREARTEGLAAGADAFLGKAEFGEQLPHAIASLIRHKCRQAESMEQ